MNDEPTDMSTEKGGKEEGLTEGLPLTTGTGTSTSTGQQQSENTGMMQQPQCDLPMVEGVSPEIPVSGAIHAPPSEDTPSNVSGLPTVEQETQQVLPNYRSVEESLDVDDTLQKDCADPQRSSMTKDFGPDDNLDVQSSTVSLPHQSMSNQKDMDHIPTIPTPEIADVQPFLETSQASADDSNTMFQSDSARAQNAISEKEVVVRQLLESHATAESNDDTASWDSWDSSPDEEEADKLVDTSTKSVEPQRQPTSTGQSLLEAPSASVQNIAVVEKMEGELPTVDAIGVSQPHNLLTDDEAINPFPKNSNTPQMVTEVQAEDIAAPPRSSRTTLSSKVEVETEPLIPSSLVSATEIVSDNVGPSTTGTVPSTIHATGRKHSKRSSKKSRHMMVEDHLEEFQQSFARKRHRSPPRVLGILLVTLILAFGSIAYSQVRLLRSTKRNTHRRGGSQTKTMGKNKVRRPDKPWFKPLGSSATPPKREEHVFQKVHRNDKPTDPPIIVVGLPKAGTSSIFQYFNCFGYWSQHWYCCGRQMNAQNPGAGPMQMMSDCIANNLAKNLSMFDGCGDFEVYAEINGPRRDPKTNKLWGNVRPRILLPQHYYLPQLYDAAPNATWILNLRPVKDWIASVANIPGNTLALQFFYEVKAQEPEHWQGKFVDRKFLAAFWSAHIKRVREFAKSHPTIRLIEVDITDENAGIKLARQLGWIGNSTTPHPFPKAGSLTTKNNTSPETIEAWAGQCWGAHNVKQHADFKNTKKTTKK